jgi:hypothetical protein
MYTILILYSYDILYALYNYIQSFADKPLDDQSRIMCVIGIGQESEESKTKKHTPEIKFFDAFDKFCKSDIYISVSNINHKMSLKNNLINEENRKKM